MTYKREKLMKIMNELVNVCMRLNMREFKVDFSFQEGRANISVEGYCPNAPLEKLQKLEDILNLPRQEELEELYWNLMGDFNGEEHLEMIGVMVDGGRVDYKDDILKISIYRDKRN